ncbi:MAG TPA: SDR family NAD(P)-dependent oxidoreductase [Chitinophagaceae bacterium]|nr:SDR family NAD(P)-dependent oxidoreductase [Chitinophagaceae bacterium]
MKYALVSGGSKGIGFAIAEALAKRNYNLVLIARGIEELQTAKNKLETEYKIHVEILPYDLSKSESADEIGKWCNERNLQLKMLCNVTGIGKAEDYLLIPLVDTLYMLKLNTEPAVSLTFYLLPVLQKNSPSYILNVSSMAGLAPIPVKNIYSATKSAIIFFSYALRYQLKKQNISVSCLCSGPVFTKPEIEKDTAQKLGWFANKIAIPAKQVGEIAVSKTLKGKMIIVPGIIASVISGFLRLMPRRLIVYIYYKLGSKNN